MKLLKKIAIILLLMFVTNSLLPVSMIKGVQAADSTMGVESELECVNSYGISNNNLQKIISKGTLTKYQMTNELLDSNSNLSKNYIDSFVSYIMEEALVEGVNHDVLYGLMMHETGFLKFGGDVKPEQNNFGGLGATGNGQPGNSFPSVQIGIRAVTQHLKAYSSTDALKQECVDQRFKYVQRGCIEYVEYLGIQENPEHKGWAAAANYGTNILRLISGTRKYPVAWGIATVQSFEVSGTEYVGNKLSIRAQGLLDGETLYRIWVCDRSTEKWTILSDWSKTKTAEFTPEKSGQYTFVVHVKHISKTGDLEDDYKAIDKNIAGPKSQVKSFDVKGENFVGSKLSISSEATPDKDTLYRIWVCDRSTEKWTILSDWSSTKTVEFTPSKVGPYTFVLHIKHKTKAGNVEDDYRAIDKNVTALKSQVKSFDIKGENFVGSKLSISSEATPDKDTLYRIWVCDRSTEKWTILSDWSSTKTAEFTPSKVGPYTFVLHIKHKTKAGNVEDDYRAIDKNITALKSQAKSFEVTGGNLPGSKQIITAEGAPDKDTLYRIWVCNRSTEKWTILSDWSSTKTAEFTPNTGGQYTFVLHVKHKTKVGDVEDDYKAINKNITILKSQVKSFVVTGGNLPGSKQIITAEGTPDKDTLYRIWVCNRSTEKWTILSDWSNTKTVEFTPDIEDQYTFVVHVKHKTKSGDIEDDYRAIDKSIISLKSKLTSFTVTGENKINSSLLIKADANLERETLYKIWVCNRSNGEWIVLSDYSTNNIVKYTPKEQGLYTFVVHVKHITKKGEVFDDYRSQDMLIAGDKLVLIDPGHGGSDTGAVPTITGGKYVEKDMNLRLAFKLRQALIEKGYLVQMTRIIDNTLDLYERPQIANRMNADLLISVHHNAFTTSSAHGVEVYYSSKSSNSYTSSKMATEISASISANTGLYNRGGKDGPNLVVCKNSNMPAVLVEAAFLSNTEDAELASQNDIQEKVAKSIADTVVKNIY